jgi:L-lactate dehydrogenase complex protein LldG
MTGMIHNRDAFLNKIANRLNRPRNITGVVRPKWKYTPQDDVLKGASQDELLEVLKIQCTKVHTNLIVTTTEELQAKLIEVVNQFGNGSIVAWKDERFEDFGLGKLLHEGWDHVCVHIWDFEKGRMNVDVADQANIGITISDITLAESGTAVLFSNQHKGRSVSFLPATSIILIPKSTIVPRMTQAARLMREKALNGKVASCINFITGPSNSADIEMNLVVGVHGPVEATYIVIEDQ